MNAADIPDVALRPAMESLARMPVYVCAAIDAASPATLLQHRVEGAFSLTEHACHLRDLEREGYLVRVKRILEEERPALEGFDGAAVARARDYPSQDGREAARDFAAARRGLIAILAPLDAASLAREGDFDGKRITLADLVAMVVDHDREHRQEIEALLAALESRRWK
jgi:uncharacterized damage-inducible protein DinB